MMKTKIKTGVSARPSYTLSNLENSKEIAALIKEAEANLSPCAHCGFTRPEILYEYSPEVENTLREYDPMLPERIPCRHEFCVWCNEIDFGNGRGYGCQMRTRDDFANDDENAIRETLGRLVKIWNRRAVI